LKAIRLPLVGVAIGDGLVDPLTMMYAKSSQSYAIGLINRQQQRVVDDMINKTITAINNKQWLVGFLHSYAPLSPFPCSSNDDDVLYRMEALKWRSQVNTYINDECAGGVNPYDYRYSLSLP
jgi:hypothetical protein